MIWSRERTHRARDDFSETSNIYRFHILSSMCKACRCQSLPPTPVNGFRSWRYSCAKSRTGRLWVGQECKLSPRWWARPARICEDRMGGSAVISEIHAHALQTSLKRWPTGGIACYGQSYACTSAKHPLLPSFDGTYPDPLWSHTNLLPSAAYMILVLFKRIVRVRECGAQYVLRCRERATFLGGQLPFTDKDPRRFAVILLAFSADILVCWVPPPRPRSNPSPTRGQKSVHPNAIFSVSVSILLSLSVRRDESMYPSACGSTLAMAWTDAIRTTVIRDFILDVVVRLVFQGALVAASSSSPWSGSRQRSQRKGQNLESSRGSLRPIFQFFQVGGVEALAPLVRSASEQLKARRNPAPAIITLLSLCIATTAR